jgi:hypothetical protein
MWQKNLIYETLPILTQTGKTRIVKQHIQKPTDLECWFSSANNTDLDCLLRMLNRGFNINTINTNGQTIGLIACEIKSYSLLAFFMKQGGDLGITYTNDKDSILKYVCYPILSSKFFKLVCNQTTLYAYLNNIEDLISLLKHENILPLFSSDKNLIKVKYLFSIINKNKHNIIKTVLLEHLSTQQLNVPKIKFFLQGKDILLSKLKTQLRNKDEPICSRRKL